MKNLLYEVLYRIFFGILFLVIGFGLGRLIGFDLTDFWQGYILASGQYIGRDVYEKIHYKLVDR